MRRKYSNRKARIEKKFSTEAMHLLIALIPSRYCADSFYRGEGYLGSIDFDEWQVCEVDYWGECDSYDSFYLLHQAIIQLTTDWEGMSRADDAEYSDREPIDRDPFYSPWRIGSVTRADIIRYCRQQVKAGVVWEGGGHA